jgi:hypothetical protein
MQICAQPPSGHELVVPFVGAAQKVSSRARLQLAAAVAAGYKWKAPLQQAIENAST